MIDIYVNKHYPVHRRMLKGEFVVIRGREEIDSELKIVRFIKLCKSTFDVITDEEIKEREDMLVNELLGVQASKDESR